MHASLAIRLRWSDDKLDEIDLDNQIPKIISVTEESGKALDFTNDQGAELLKIELDNLLPHSRSRKEATIVVTYDVQANGRSFEKSPLLSK